MTTMTLPALPPVSSLESYVQAVNTVPMLTQERETQLGRRLQQENDVTAASDLVMSHLRLVVSVARNYMGYGLPQADLVQEGNIGLMKAVKRFDPERGVRLASFAIHWIKAEIHEYILRNWRLVKVATTKAQRKLFFNLRSMKPTLSALKPKEIAQIAKVLNVKEREVIEMEQRLRGGDIPLEPSPDDSQEESISPIAYLVDSAEGPAETFEREQGESLKTRGLTKALEGLDERSRRIIRARWLAESDPKTLQELADEFSVSAERIRQIEAKAMQKMKKELVAVA